jgi:hypothetical protein
MKAGSTINATSLNLRAPERSAMLRESRVLLDVARMALPLLLRAPVARAKQRRDILVLPGFGADDRATWPLRHFLKKHGHKVEGWGLGLNRAGADIEHRLGDLSATWDITPKAVYCGEGAVPMLCDRMTEKVRARFALTGKPVTLIGWSLGGYVAREVARELPEAVEQVITLGSPVQGGPKYTAAAKYFKARGMDLDWMEREIAKREVRPIQVPITAIVSTSDGVVGLAAAIDHHSPNVRHIQVDAAHFGLCFNPSIWALVIEALQRLPAR